VWDTSIEVLRALILTVAQAMGGSVGGSIALVSFAFRLALIPLSLRVARRMRVQQAKLAELKPQLERLKKRHSKDSHALARETMALYKRNVVRLMDPLMLASMAIQLPLLGGLFAAVRAGLGAGKRYLWIADLSRPDVLLAMVASALVAGSVALAPQTGEGAQAATMFRISIVLAAVMTLVMLLSSSAAIAVSVAGGAVGAGVQGGGGRRQEKTFSTPPGFR
jgi:YidC/Oxa1 family membrane protein insertase